MINIRRTFIPPQRSIMKHVLNSGLLITLLVLIAGCSYPISKGLRQEAAKDITFARVLAKPAAYHGTIVIWGGIIVETVKGADGTDLVVSETPLDFNGKPRDFEFAEGRFIAKSSLRLDPDLYAEGRKVVLGGEIVAEQLGTLNNEPYLYPVVKIRELHLWEKRGLQWDWWNIPYRWPRVSPEGDHHPEP